MTTEQQVEETKTPPTETQQVEEQPLDIDFDRIKGGDEEYTRQVNERLAKEVIPDPAAIPAETNPVEKATPAPPPADDFVNFDDGDPIYNGTPFKVKKSELKTFVQKGRHLETKLNEFAPFVSLARNYPEIGAALVAAAQDQGKAAEIARLLGMKPKEEVAPSDEPIDLDVPGYNKDDVIAVAKIQRALRAKEEARRQEAEKAEMQTFLARKEMEAMSMVHGLRALEGEAFERVRPAMQQRIAQLEAAAENGTITKEQFAQFKSGLTDPTAVDDQGTPLFIRFYRDIKAEMSAAAPPVAGTRPPPTNNARLEPGTSSPRGGSSDAQLDWASMSQAEFDRRISEKLSRL